MTNYFGLENATEEEVLSDMEAMVDELEMRQDIEDELNGDLIEDELNGDIDLIEREQIELIERYLQILNNCIELEEIEMDLQSIQSRLLPEQEVRNNVENDRSNVNLERFRGLRPIGSSDLRLAAELYNHSGRHYSDEETDEAEVVVFVQDENDTEWLENNGFQLI